MLLSWVRVALVGQCLEGTDEPRPRLGRSDDIVDVATGRGHVGIGELGLIVRYETNLGLPGDYTGWAPDERPPYDGVAEFWMDATLEELQARIQERWDVVNPDERAFLGTYRAMIVDERLA